MGKWGRYEKKFNAQWQKEAEFAGMIFRYNLRELVR